MGSREAGTCGKRLYRAVRLTPCLPGCQAGLALYIHIHAMYKDQHKKLQSTIAVQEDIMQGDQVETRLMSLVYQPETWTVL